MSRVAMNNIFLQKLDFAAYIMTEVNSLQVREIPYCSWNDFPLPCF